jgi:hypothetical protein
VRQTLLAWRCVTTTAIIGGGLNGLTCAALLAKKGHKVVVLEASDAVGGIAAPHGFHPGFRSAGLLHDTTGLPAARGERAGPRKPACASPAAARSRGAGRRRRSPLIPGVDDEKRIRQDGRGRRRLPPLPAALDPCSGVLARSRHAAGDVVHVETVSRWELLKRAMKVRRLGGAT